MDEIIYIPTVRQNDRIGSVFNDLYRIMKATDSTHGENVVWDFSHCCFLHASFIALLAMYKASTYKHIQLQNISSDIHNYLTTIHFEHFLNIESTQALSDVLNDYLKKTYIPICRFTRSNNNLDKMQTIIQSVIEQQICHSDLRTPLSYLFGELVGNITDHSECKYGCIFSQYYASNNKLEICIIDDGITIGGSYIKAGIANQEDTTDAKAIERAINGISTKNLPNAENRGYGLSTSMNMIVNGLGGAFFILSGGAFFRYTKDKKELVELPEEYVYNGTAILLNIPTNVPKEFNYLNYI